MAKIVLHPINKLFVLFMQTILEFCPDPRVTNIVPALAAAKEVLLTNVFSKVSNHLLQKRG